DLDPVDDMRLISTVVLTLSTLGPLGLAAQATPLPLEEGSIFAVVTHKSGLASGLAHNHFVVADRFLAEFAFDEADPTNSTLRFSTLTEDLVIDDPELQAAWIDRIRALGLVDEFGDLDEGNRAKVRAQMLHEDQLDPENYSVIGAQVTSIAASTTEIGEVQFDLMATVDVTIHGTTVTREVPVRYERSGEALAIEGVGRFQFEEFGIKPYSAFLGTVKVQNDFEIYLNLKTTVVDSEATTGSPNSPL
ncbi:MAG: YceI family protein, partial [Longimicrobiales bacterium]